MKNKDKYLNTVFETGQNSFPRRFAIISAYNPDGASLSEKENEQRHAALLEVVSKNTAWKHTCFEITGKSPCGTHRERGLGIEYALEQAVELGKAFQQEAIFRFDATKLELVDLATGETTAMASFRYSRSPELPATEKEWSFHLCARWGNEDAASEISVTADEWEAIQSGYGDEHYAEVDDEGETFSVTWSFGRDEVNIYGDDDRHCFNGRLSDLDIRCLARELPVIECLDEDILDALFAFADLPNSWTQQQNIYQLDGLGLIEKIKAFADSVEREDYEGESGSMSFWNHKIYANDLPVFREKLRDLLRGELQSQGD